MPESAGAPALLTLGLTAFRFGGAPLPQLLQVRVPDTGGFIGRGQDNLLVLPDLEGGISKQHCEILVEPAGFRALDRSRNGTFLNDRGLRVDRRQGTALVNGDRLLIGPYEILIRIGAAAGEADAAPALADLGVQAWIRETGITPPDDPAFWHRAGALLAAASTGLAQLLAGDALVHTAWGEGAEDGDAPSLTPPALLRRLLSRAADNPAHSRPAQLWARAGQGQDAVLAAAYAGAGDLFQRCAPEAIYARIDATNRYASALSNARKSHAWDLLYADFHPRPPEPPADAPADFVPEKPAPIDFAQRGRAAAAAAYAAACAKPALPDDLCGRDPVPRLTLTARRQGGAKLTPPPVFVSTGEPVTIGRGSAARFVLPDPRNLLSRLHCGIAWVDGAWRVSNESAGGSFLNRPSGKLPDGAPTVLQDGDRLLLGPYEIHIGIEGGVISRLLAAGPTHPALDALLAGAKLDSADLQPLDPVEIMGLAGRRLADLAGWLARRQQADWQAWADLTGTALATAPLTGGALATAPLTGGALAPPPVAELAAWLTGADPDPLAPFFAGFDRLRQLALKLPGEAQRRLALELDPNVIFARRDRDSRLQGLVGAADLGLTALEGLFPMALSQQSWDFYLVEYARFRAENLPARILSAVATESLG